jgi:hypothetical protein
VTTGRESAVTPLPGLEVPVSAVDALNKLAKWRKFFAGWQLGTRHEQDGESRAVRDHREVTLLLRAEVSAIAGLMLRKGVITGAEWDAALEEEARALDEMLERRFPGFTTSQGGLTMKLPEAAQTMADLGFPP